MILFFTETFDAIINKIKNLNAQVIYQAILSMGNSQQELKKFA